MCGFCTVFARHPCSSREEASRCPNCDDRGNMFDFEPRDVAEWIRSRAQWSSKEDELNAAADLVEKL